MAKITTTLFGALALIPQVAEVPITETLSFLTDENVSYNGTEQMIQLRNKPRQTFKYTIPFDPRSDADIWNTSWGAVRKKWAIPVWHDAQSVGNVTAGLAYVLCDTTYYDLRASSLAMLFNGCGQYQILEITTVAGDRINISGVTVASIGAFLIPVRIGYVRNSIGKNTSGYSGKLDLTLDVIDTAEVVPSAPTQYLSNDIYFDPGMLASGSVDTEFEQREDVIDFEVGPFEKRTPWTRAKFGKTYRAIMGTPQERKTYRDFIHRRNGRVRPFWMPTFESNLRVKNTGTVVSTLVTWRDSNTEYAADRTHVAFDTDGGWLVRILSAPTISDATTMQFTLDSALNIPATSIRRVSYLGLNRLNSDNIEFNYTSSKVVESAVRILEVSP